MLSCGVTKYSLPNGLTVLIKESHAVPVVAIQTYVKAGYFNEADRLAGISHLIEHMFFKGTRKRGVGEMARQTKSLGGYLNASTIYDHTLYYTVLPAANFTKGLEIQSDALINSVFDPDELKKETEVVIQEAKRKWDTPGAVVREKLFELAFDEHRIRRWRIGTESGLRALTRADFLTFYNNLYRPQNIILVVVGDVETAQAQSAIEKYYQHFEQGTLRKETSPAEKPQTEFRYNCLHGDILQSYLTIGFHVPGILHEDSYALEMLAFILGRGKSSRLFQNVKEKTHLVNTVSASNYTLSDLGVFMIDVNCQTEKLRDAEEAIFQEMEKIRQRPVESFELTRAHNLIEAIYVSTIETVAGQANVLADFEALGDYRMVEEFFSKLTTVTVEDIYRVANEYLTLTNCSLLEYVPADCNMPAAQSTELAERFEKYLSSQPGQSQSTQSAPPPFQNQFEIVALKPAREEISKQVLAGGATLIVKPASYLPLASIGVFAKGGRLHETAENAGLTALSLRTALKGTTRRTAAELALEMENLGSQIRFSNRADYAGYAMNILSKNFEAGCEVLFDVITAPLFSVEETNKEKDNQLALISREKDDMFQQPLKLFNAVLFPNHPYGLPNSGTEKSVINASDGAARSWHSRLFSQKNLLVVVVGDVEEKQVKALVEARLGAASSESRFEKASDLEINFPTAKAERVEVRDKQQTALILGFPGPAYSEPEFYALTVLQNILSGLGNRLFEELRGKQSLAYMVSAYLVSRLQGGSFLSYIATSPEKEETAKNGLLREFEKLTRERVTKEELQRAICYIVGAFQISMETFYEQMQKIANYEILEKGPEELQAFPDKIKTVTAENILQAAQKYFNLDRYALGVVRGNKAG